MTITIHTIITAISTLITWLLSKKFLFPQLLKFWQWLKERKKENENHNVNLKKELTDLTDKSNDVYENQITFLMQQVKQLKNELIEYQKQLEQFRSKILELNNNLYHKSLTIGKLRQFCCKMKNAK